MSKDIQDDQVIMLPMHEAALFRMAIEAAERVLKTCNETITIGQPKNNMCRIVIQPTKIAFLAQVFIQFGFRLAAHKIIND